MGDMEQGDAGERLLGGSLMDGDLCLACCSIEWRQYEIKMIYYAHETSSTVEMYPRL